jgi:hypothetical protein
MFSKVSNFLWTDNSDTMYEVFRKIYLLNTSEMPYFGRNYSTGIQWGDNSAIAQFFQNL